MDNHFIILHLSDTHIGAPRHDISSLRIFAPLFLDIEKFQQKGIRPNLIVFSGDLSYGELKDNPLHEQYKNGYQWIRKVYDAIRCSFDQVPILIVPGNHDMNRLSKDNAHDLWIDELGKKEQLYDHMYSKTQTWQNILKRQQAWAEFVKSIENKNVTYDYSLNMSTAKIMQGGYAIGIAGFNSSWASYKDKHDSNLWIGRYQIEQALNQLSDCDFKIAVSHHPTSCLHDLERSWISQKLSR